MLFIKKSASISFFGTTDFKTTFFPSGAISLMYASVISEAATLFGTNSIVIENDAYDYIAGMAKNDLRYAYNLLEIAFYTSSDKNVTIENVREINNKPAYIDDKNGDSHYDLLSALQKSIRGSDVDASIYYLARLIHAGDFDSIYRRLSVITYEDIGLANPSMGPKVHAAVNAVERLGLPEARIPLAKTVIEMALSPKSNSAYLALDTAINDINKGNTGNVPNHIKTSSNDYKYPHDYPNHYVKQQYLPDNLLDEKFYYPGDNGYEKDIKLWFNKIKE